MTSATSTRTRKLARNAGVISVATFLSRVLGFVRDLILAAVLGAGPLADAFFVAFRLPNVLRRLFAEGSLTMAIVPVYTRYRKTQGEESADVVARSVQVWLLVILCTLSLAAVFFSGGITALVAPGFRSNPEIFRLTSQLVRICFPYIVFISSVALCMGILNSRGHFLAPALAPCVLNIVLIAAAGLAWLAQISIPYTLAWAVLIAGLGQWLLQQPFLRQKGFQWTGKVEMNHPGVKQIGRLMLPTVLGAAAYQLNILIGTMLASLLPFGSVSYLYYADRLVQFPLGVFGVAVSTAALPSLSSLAAKQDLRDFKHTLNTTIGLTLFISIPAAAGLIGMGEPLIQILFGRGRFDQLAVTATNLALLGYASGLPAFSAVRSLISAFYALEDTRTPVFVSILCMLFNICAGYLLMQHLNHLGLALAASLASWINVLLLGIFLRRRIGSWGDLSGPVTQTAALSLGLLVLAWGAARTLHPWMCLALVPILGAGFMFLALKIGIAPARITADGLSERLWRKK
ncbi:MAG: murein biosynthesis integral membrane protein MurJ [Desulfonatronovibrionaceae bacterium]